VEEHRNRSSLLPVITGIFVTVLVLTPSASSKFLSIGSISLGGLSTGPLSISGSTLFFPISYIFGDIFTEVYGYARSRRIIWLGFACQAFAAAIYSIIQYWPAASFWDNQAAYDSILGQAPRIVLASLSAYFVGEFVNSFIVSRMKWRQKGKAGTAMGARFVVSTIFGEFFDSAVFIGVGFAGVMATGDLIKTIATIWIIKVIYEIVALPVSMRITAWVKRQEGIDELDDPNSTSYSPFQI
jgi:uncharacterized integral membrane protein (TIGR00697 family)